MKPSRFQKIMGVEPKKKEQDITSTEPVSEDDKTIFMCNEVSRSKRQEQLDELNPDERVVWLTSNRKTEIFTQLEECSSSGKTEIGKALFQEYQECLDDD